MRWEGSVVVAAVVVACSGSSGGGSVVVSADTACSNFADAICNALNGCAPAILKVQYGDVSTCTTRQKTSCVPTLNAPGSALTTTQLASCANLLPNAACDDLLARNLPDDCRAKAGSLADGAACADDSQCANRKCKKHKDAACGVCAKPAAAGASCEIDENCDYGLVCSNASVCVVPAMGGAACDKDHPCAASFACNDKYTCVASPGPGEHCEGGAVNTCSLALGAWVCHVTATASTCEALGIAMPGQTCGALNDTLTVCSASGTCLPPLTQAATGTCAVAAADGQSCNTDPYKGPACLPPAKCDAGVCKLPDPAACQ